ncbi:hypothetical protein B9Y60_14665 [Stenotrophomonas maltophilia]|uniref:hypothetical protein n=1 Tax=Stenotrophomonas maltophilia TaxID=40324 RepID=UPI000C2667E1|nr:hypothetical protein [Stenotrophomonas maltophilia]PJL51026.1 hypothetical protein B9Y73_14665 [Stenotrophomonas maltophilia]PJL54602.1 hypothetical protein B9Y60_14665 [Stenotrophomonas maltophilia]
MSAPVDVVALLRALQSQIGPSRPDEDDDEVDADAWDRIDAAISGLGELINAAQNARASIQHMRGPEAIIHARTAELDAALARVKGGAA